MSRKLPNAFSRPVDYKTDEPLGRVPRGFRPATFEGIHCCVRNGYSLAKCTGEAHSNPHIDNCMQCAPLWGVVAVKDQTRARRTKLLM